MPWAEPDPGNTEPLLTREWLLTNGLGGYASGTIAGAATPLSRSTHRGTPGAARPHHDVQSSY